MGEEEIRKLRRPIMIPLLLVIAFIVSVLLFLFYQHRRFTTFHEHTLQTSEQHKAISQGITKGDIKRHEDELYTHLGLDDDQFCLKYSSPTRVLLWKLRFAQALGSAPKTPNSLALDVGGGDGNLTMYARKTGLLTVCLEISEPKLRKGTLKFRNRGIPFDAINADATHLPFKKETFASSFCLDVLEHIPNGGDCVKEMHRVLSANGNVVATTPCATALRIFNVFEAAHKLKAIISGSNLQAERMYCSNHRHFGCKGTPYIFHRDFTPNELINGFPNPQFKVSDVHTYDNRLLNALITLLYKATRFQSFVRVTAQCLNHLVSVLPYLKYLGQEIIITCTKEE